MSAARWIIRTIGQVVVFLLLWFCLTFYLVEYAPLSPANKDGAHWLALIGVVLAIAAWGVFLAMVKAIGNAARGE